MSKILLSINPEYANRILDGSKKYEFRKRLPQKYVDKIIIYSTSPEMQVVGEVDVIDVLSFKKTPLWEKTKNHAGISRKKYREYFANVDIAYAYKLGNVTKFNPAKTLADYGVETAPQSFLYIE